jgi:hypothetical protein
MGELNKSEICKRLNYAETTIGLGRRAVKALQEDEPVDLEAIEAERVRILGARLKRNALRAQLLRAKQVELMRGHNWVATGSGDSL